MDLQETLNDSELEMTLPQVRAFLLGVLSAERPLPYNRAMEEMLGDVEDQNLVTVLRPLYDALVKKRNHELAVMFENTDLEEAKDQLDFFLTALNLSGTTSESTKNEDLANIIDELEDIVLELDDPDLEDPDEVKEYLRSAWEEFVEIKTNS